MKPSNNGLIYANESFGAAIAQENYNEAWKLANKFWQGSPRKQRVVLFSMLSKVLENQKIIVTQFLGKTAREVEK